MCHLQTRDSSCFSCRYPLLLKLRDCLERNWIRWLFQVMIRVRLQRICRNIPKKVDLYVYVHARVQVILSVKLLRVCIGSPVWYNVIGFIFTFSTMNYIIQPFPLQSWWVLCTFYLANLVYIHIKTRVSTTATGRGPLPYLEASTTFLIFCSLWHIICWSYFLLQFERAQRKGSNGNTLTLKAFE